MLNSITIFQHKKCTPYLAVRACVQCGGPIWDVQLGRRDSLSASKAAAENNIPGPNSTVDTLISKFSNVGLGLIDMVALSGAHSIGKARCPTFAARLQLQGAGDQEFIQSLSQLCATTASASTVADLDLATPATFDNHYYINLLSDQGLLPSDQALVSENNEATRELVLMYAQNPDAFFQDFKDSMMRMGSLVSDGADVAQVRKSCRFIN